MFKSLNIRSVVGYPRCIRIRFWDNQYMYVAERYKEKNTPQTQWIW